MATQSELKRRLKTLLNRPENLVCADCPERQPRWASLIKAPPGTPPGSLPVGAFMCLECSGSHRRLGVHISFVRSISLDTWKESEVVAMEKGGNKKVNAIFEGRLGGATKPTIGASGIVRERFIRDKYERRKYFNAGALDQVYGDNANDSDSDDSSSEEEVFTRAPSNTARIRAQQRSRNAINKPTIVSMPKRRTTRTAPPPPAAPPPQPEVVDLLDFTTPVAASPTPTTAQPFLPSSQPPSAPLPSSPPPVQNINNQTSSPSHNIGTTNDRSAPNGKMTSKQILAMFNTPSVNMVQPASNNNMNPMMQQNNNLNNMNTMPQNNNMNMMQGRMMPNNNNNMNMMQMQQQQNQQQQMMMMMMMQKNMMQQQNNNNNSSQTAQGMQNLNMNSNNNNNNNNNMSGIQSNNMMQGMQKNMMQGMQFNNMSASNNDQSHMMQGKKTNANMSINSATPINNMSNKTPMGGMPNQMIMGGMPNSGTYNPMAGMQHMNQQQQYGGQRNNDSSGNSNNNSQQFNAQFGGMRF